ncbi:hypothetical protein GW17_00051872 [Ensete ventricosum]|nr:hypothetical protein GW17_00051872 [Ensete ventricosum]
MGTLITSGSPSRVKNVVKLYVVAEESARLGSARVRKLIRIGREETRKLERGRLGSLRNTARLGPLGKAHWAPSSRGLPGDPARRPRRGGAPDVAPPTIKSVPQLR